MIYKNLFKEVLLNPIDEGADQLKIISGYASASMASRHLEEALRKNNKLKIDLTIGMVPKDGIAISNHLAFKDILESEKFKNNFSCNYLYQKAPVHTKLFLWFQSTKFHSAYIGSANYSQLAFSTKQRELMCISENKNLIDYYLDIEKDTIDISHSEIEEHVKILSDKNYYNNFKALDNDEVNDSVTESYQETVSVPLYSLQLDEVQKKGGLNWGQRKGRNPNQAYIQLTPEIYKSNFFPKRPAQFTVLTDDFKSLLCVRAQKEKYGGQAIETTLNNAHLGEYFRMRMKLSSGAPIWKEDLIKYGRTNVTFIKIDDETYYMDFSVE